MKNYKRLAGVLILVLFVTCLAKPMPARGVSLAESIKNKTKQVENSKKLTDQLKQNIKQAESAKQELEALKEKTDEYIKVVDQKVEEANARLAEYDEMISAKEAEIEETNSELDAAIAEEEAQYEAMKQRIRFMYECGDTFYLEIMLTSKSFGDFLTKANYIEKLSEYDRNKYNEYEEARQWTELVKVTLETEKEALDEARAAQKAEQEMLEEIMMAKHNMVAQYDHDIAIKQGTISELEDEYAEQTAVIEQLERQIAEERKKLNAQNQRRYDGGVFTFPAPSYVRITDDFGWRSDPFTGARSYHSGIDIGSAYGTPIVAAYDGVVVSAAYDWSMGNYVMIDHGDNLYTIYMHSSAIYVHVGETVVRGQQIASVGSTGRSTAAHLHFGVRRDGAYVSPWEYLK